MNTCIKIRNRQCAIDSFFFSSFLFEILDMRYGFPPLETPKGESLLHFKPNKCGLVGAWILQWKTFSICLNAGSRTSQSLSAATKPRRSQLLQQVLSKRTSWEAQLLFHWFNSHFPLFNLVFVKFVTFKKRKQIMPKAEFPAIFSWNYIKCVQPNRQKSLWTEASISSKTARCCFLPNLRGCLFWSVPQLLNLEGVGGAGNPKQRGQNLKQIDPLIDWLIDFFWPFFGGALGEQMRKHFHFQSSAAGQRPQMLANKQATPAATVCPRSYLCV